MKSHTHFEKEISECKTAMTVNKNRILIKHIGKTDRLKQNNYIGRRHIQDIIQMRRKLVQYFGIEIITHKQSIIHSFWINEISR